jgi:preprotein translocase subunit SecY
VVNVIGYRNYNLALVVIVACVLLTMAIRRYQYALVVLHSGDFEQDMMGGNRQWIPLKLNASGVAYYLCSGYHVYTCGCGWFI